MTAPSAALGPRTSLAIRLHHAIATLDRFPLSVLQLMFRIAIAAVFWSSGLTKIASWDTTIALFRDEYMVPLLPDSCRGILLHLDHIDLVIGGSERPEEGSVGKTQGDPRQRRM